MTDTGRISRMIIKAPLAERCRVMPGCRMTSLSPCSWHTDRRCNQGSRMEFNASMCRIAKSQGVPVGQRGDGGVMILNPVLGNLRYMIARSKLGSYSTLSTVIDRARAQMWDWHEACMCPTSLLSALTAHVRFLGFMATCASSSFWSLHRNREKTDRWHHN